MGRHSGCAEILERHAGLGCCGSVLGVYRWGDVLLCVAGAGLDSGGRGWPGQRAMESFRSRTGQVTENRQSGRWTKINR
jgi:hypothetical protein